MTPNQAAVFFRDHYDHWRTSEDREPEAINDDDNEESKKEIDDD